MQENNKRNQLKKTKLKQKSKICRDINDFKVNLNLTSLCLTYKCIKIVLFILFVLLYIAILT